MLTTVLMFLFVGIAMLFNKILPSMNKYLIPIIIIVVLCIGLFLSLIVFGETDPLDILLFYFTPLYVGAFILIGLIQYERNAR
ncbi:hypothetical protein [Sutcliffiella halmapala]|uniref:hypothetical protein n=1 Tax=Sutcliffiella halmapala TaxID=79882 RepID=UPI000995479E|nr:hypothetical protein [Sutcliffiella halmapala]